MSFRANRIVLWLYAVENINRELYINVDTKNDTPKQERKMRPKKKGGTFFRDESSFIIAICFLVKYFSPANYEIRESISRLQITDE